VKEHGAAQNEQLRAEIVQLKEQMNHAELYI